MTTENITPESVETSQKETECYIQVDSGLKEYTYNQPKRKIGEKTVKGIIVGTGDNRAIIPLAEVEKLAELHLTYTHMADYYGVKESTFKDHFRHVVEIGRAKTKQKLMNAMLTNALDKHNPTIQIWLSKNLLGFTDQPINTDEDQVLPWLEQTNS